MSEQNQNQSRETRKAPRATEPMPKSFKQLWILMLVLAMLVLGVAAAAYIADRMFYAW